MSRPQAALALLAFLLPACGTNPPPAPPPVDTEAGLKELGEVYKYRAAQKMPAPSRVDDLAEHDAALGNAWPAIQEGKIVVVWRAGYSSGSTDVLAYEKDTPTGAGNVLLRNGTVSRITADQFRAAKK
jgi:hypothetical protein